ncbi:MAG: site-specific integrase [Bryobacterales bacterium]|nr:site-specific integrase [Bryobacterales bacterium]
MTALRRRMSQDMQLKNLSPRTQATYLGAVSRFDRHFGKSPEVLGPEHIRQYQVHLVTEKNLGPSAINVSVYALRFLYNFTLGRNWNFDRVLPHPKLPKKLPTIPSPQEVARFLNAVTSLPHYCILCTCYAAGLRISEALKLRPGDIDSLRSVIRVAQGKGAKDRYVMLSSNLRDVLRHYWHQDRPDSEWLFPSRSDPTRPISTASVRARCRLAVRASRLPKKITPHTLRHAFAGHLLESGTNLRTIQLLMGHRSRETTARYLHLTPGQTTSGTSPLDQLPRPACLQDSPRTP